MDCIGVASAVLAAVSKADVVGKALLLLEGVSDGTKGVADEEEVGEALLLATWRLRLGRPRNPLLQSPRRRSKGTIAVGRGCTTC
jgi:hypothetical protein